MKSKSVADASVLRKSLLAMARAVSEADGDEKRRIEEECRSLHRQGVGRWMGCASFYRIFKVLQTDAKGDIALGMTRQKCPRTCLVSSACDASLRTG